jgi:GR25 family glycosyltransferase involved in LPS biosynthesis
LISAFSSIQVAFSDGLAGNTIHQKALPAGTPENMADGVKGSWRAHLNAVKAVVDQNLTTALLIEDDVDWDVNIKSQLQQFALGVRALTTPRLDGTFADPTYPSPRDNSDPVDISYSSLSPTIPVVDSPYGNGWDVLWLGHCGNSFPDKERDRNIPRGRVIINDHTVPSTQHYVIDYGSDELVVRYPNHTRAISHTGNPACSLAYAVTQKAARRILYEFGLKSFYAPFDLMLRLWCDGRDGRKVRGCYTVQPQYFNHYRPVGRTRYYSDINEWEDKHNSQAFTNNIRWSMRMNLEKLTEGESDLVDQYPDDLPRQARDI